MQVDPSTIPKYVPKCCPVPANTDPRRNIPYVKPKPSRSEPLSHHEYLRQKKANNNSAVSAPSVLRQTPITGQYQTTLWMESGKCCSSGAVLPPVPAVHQGGHALESGLLTKMEGAAAARGKLGHYDTTNHTEWNTTYRKQGIAVIQDNEFKAPAGGTRESCTGCVLEGTSNQVVPGNPTCC
jgi:hypothetical protein